MANGRRESRTTDSGIRIVTRWDALGPYRRGRTQDIALAILFVLVCGGYNFAAFAFLGAITSTREFETALEIRLLVILIVAVASFWGIIALLKPRRTLLYLRRFEDPETTARLSGSLPRWIFPHFAVITIHDAATNPTYGVSTLPYLAVIALAFPLTFVPEFRLLLGAAAAAYGLLHRRIDEAVVRSESCDITDDGSLQAAVSDAEQWSRSLPRRLFGPLFVARVHPAMWKEALLRFVPCADAVLIDVSVPGDGLLWELETLLPRLGGRVVLFGAEENVRAWNQAPEDERALRLQQVLNGRTVLVGNSSGKRKGALLQRLYRQRPHFKVELAKALFDAVKTRQNRLVVDTALIETTRRDSPQIDDKTTRSDAWWLQTSPRWQPPPGQLPGGGVCHHEGEAANYCTRCWAYLKPEA